MLVKFTTGTNAGTVAHAPRGQFTDLLIQAGILEVAEQPKPDPAEACRQGLLVLPEGWYVNKRVGNSGDEAAILRHVDNTGCVTCFTSANPPLVRKWVFDQTKDEDGHYEMVSPLTDCPPPILARFKELLVSNDPEVAADRGMFYRDAINRQQYDQDQQENLCKRIINTIMSKKE